MERGPTLQPLELLSPSMKNSVSYDVSVPLACSRQPGEESGEPGLEDAVDKLERPSVERGTETPEMVNQPSECRYPVRIRNPPIKLDL